MIVMLIKPHTHAGVRYQAGEQIDVPHSVAIWLEERGVAARVEIKPRPARRRKTNPSKE